MVIKGEGDVCLFHVYNHSFYLTSTILSSRKWPTTVSGTKGKIIGMILGPRKHGGSLVGETTNIRGKERGENSTLG